MQAIHILVHYTSALRNAYGIHNSLDPKLNEIMRALEDTNQNNDIATINVLNAFSNEVEAQKGRMISEINVEMMNAVAQYIIAMLTD